jgi:hypothetical protein
MLAHWAKIIRPFASTKINGGVNHDIQDAVPYRGRCVACSNFLRCFRPEQFIRRRRGIRSRRNVRYWRNVRYDGRHIGRRDHVRPGRNFGNRWYEQQHRAIDARCDHLRRHHQLRHRHDPVANIRGYLPGRRRRFRQMAPSCRLHLSTIYEPASLPQTREGTFTNALLGRSRISHCCNSLRFQREALSYRAVYPREARR